MIITALIVTTLLALIAMGFIAGAMLFLIKSRATAPAANSETPLPKAAILLALRGPDAHLADCVRSLLKQDYPDYDLHIVVDSDKDPAWNIVTRVIKEEGAKNVQAALLRDPLFTCSLKCSALLQMLREIDTDVDVVALIDGDVVPHRAWLRQLVAPLADDGVGASFGIPWYFPTESNWASVARKVCWSPAGILMALCGWIWGGTAALPSRVFRDPALVERWSRSVSSDASIRDVIKADHLRLKWVPALVMPNFEPARLDVLVNQLARSLATSRLYLNRWPVTLLAVSLAAGGLLLAVLVCVVNSLAANMTGTVISAVGLIGYFLILMALLLAVERRALEITSNNGAEIPALSFRMLVKMLISIPLAHGLYLTSAFRAHNVRSVTWRGVRYAINGKLDVQRVEPGPLVDADLALMGPENDTEIGPASGNYFTARLNRWRPTLFRDKNRESSVAKQHTFRSSELAHGSVKGEQL